VKVPVRDAITNLARLLEKRRSLVAALVAAYAVWRYGRYLVVGWLQVHNLPFIDGPATYLWSTGTSPPRLGS
jgi:hypothetical protein